LRDDGRIEARGRVPVLWGATHPPRRVERGDRSAQVRYELDLPPGEQIELAWALSAGQMAVHADALAHHAEALAEAHAYAHWLSTRLETGDPLLQSLFVAGLNLAVVMFKDFPGGFCGLVAGREYAHPQLSAAGIRRGPRFH
jgi:hypothetical protein